MRVHFVHHPDDARLVEQVVALGERHDVTTSPSPAECDVVVVLASRAALRDGLGSAPRDAFAAAQAAGSRPGGVPVLPVILGDDVVPRPYLAARKHIAIATDAPSLLRLLEDHRKNASAKIADGKRELFGYGLLLALMGRAGG